MLILLKFKDSFCAKYIFPTFPNVEVREIGFHLRQVEKYISQMNQF